MVSNMSSTEIFSLGYSWQSLNATCEAKRLTRAAQSIQKSHYFKVLLGPGMAKPEGAREQSKQL